jgi:hypothetical protein
VLVYILEKYPNDWYEEHNENQGYDFEIVAVKIVKGHLERLFFAKYEELRLHL